MRCCILYGEMSYGGQAHQLIYAAIKKGRIIKPTSCEWCGSAKRIQAHHEDYNQPFEIDWLCEKCHRARHEVWRALTGHVSIYRYQCENE